MAPYTIRAAKVGEGKRLSAIEAAAGEMFRDIGMDDVADAGANTPGQYERWIAAGQVTAALRGKRACALLVQEPLDGAAFICEVSVHPGHAGQGLGAQLIAQLPRPTTLSCFTQVPWNRAYYRRIGFVEVEPRTLGPGHMAIAADEAKRFAPWPRCIMMRA
ncbi:MAG: GNAT family N-acetyltransferase [Pseudomonadota bacterium]